MALTKSGQKCASLGTFGGYCVAHRGPYTVAEVDHDANEWAKRVGLSNASASPSASPGRPRAVQLWLWPELAATWPPGCLCGEVCCGGC